MAKIKAGVVKPEMSLEEFESVLKLYKVNSPKKFEAKEKSGEFKLKASKLKSSKKAEPKKEEPKKK